MFDYNNWNHFIDLYYDGLLLRRENIDYGVQYVQAVGEGAGLVEHLHLDITVVINLSYSN